MKDKTIAQMWGAKTFPFKLYDKGGNTIYVESSNRCWGRWERDEDGNVVYYENSGGFWERFEYDEDGDAVYCENSTGYVEDNRPKPAIKMTVTEIAAKLGHDVEIIKVSI